MAHSRAALADAIRPFGPGGRLGAAHVPLIDALADALGLPRVEGAAAAPAEPLRGGDLKPSEAAVTIVKHFEGLHKLRPDGQVAAYQCPAGVWTIGYGATGAGIRDGVAWSRRQCEERLGADLEEFSAGVRKAVAGSKTSQNEFDALVSFAFNVGLGALQRSTLLKKHRTGDKDGAAAEFGKWTKANKKELGGLVRRRRAEAGLYHG